MTKEQESRAPGMTLEGLDHLLDAYGADPLRWPDDRRQAAVALLAGSPAARQAQLRAAALDRLLDSVPDAPPSAALVGRVLAARPQPRGAAFRWPPWLSLAPRRDWMPAASLGAAALVGLAVGASFPALSGAEEGAVTLEEVQFLALGPAVTEPLP